MHTQTLTKIVFVCFMPQLIAKLVLAILLLGIWYSVFLLSCPHTTRHLVHKPQITLTHMIICIVEAHVHVVTALET